MKRTLSVITIGLLVATSMAFASGEALNQADSQMIFGEQENSAITLEKDEMKVTEGKYWRHYSDYSRYSYSYCFECDSAVVSQTLGVGDSSAGNSVNAIAGLIPVLSTTAVASSSIVGGNISVDQ